MSAGIIILYLYKKSACNLTTIYDVKDWYIDSLRECFCVIILLFISKWLEESVVAVIIFVFVFALDFSLYLYLLWICIRICIFVCVFIACNAKSLDLIESEVVIIFIRRDVCFDAVVEREN